MFGWKKQSFGRFGGESESKVCISYIYRGQCELQAAWVYAGESRRLGMSFSVQRRSELPKRLSASGLPCRLRVCSEGEGRNS